MFFVNFFPGFYVELKIDIMLFLLLQKLEDLRKSIHQKLKVKAQK